MRTIEDLRSVLADEKCNKTGPAYFMYRDLAKSESDRSWLRNHLLRYDITVMPPAVVCGEFVKTKGHYHPDNSLGYGYPEIYEIIEGKAEYLLQENRLLDAVTVKAREGNTVLIPPGYGHVTINTGNEKLVMANIVSTAFESCYGGYESHRGGVYYCMEDGTYQPNPRYPEIPFLRHRDSCNFGEFSYLRNVSLYGLIGSQGALEFLNQPEHFDFGHVLTG
ncbi:MAG TPA: glucose-6-phosphate isomerase family protein [Methanoregulaceae archaeon]|nr:glucose-6-phosphate isomerase family protein [Methanoregulaceae archaeon]